MGQDGPKELGMAVCPVPLCLWWALRSTLEARRALAVLGRDGHPCSCFSPGLAELSWWPSGPQADTGTRCWEQDRQLALCSGSELDHDLSLLFFCKGRDSHSLPVPGVHLVPFPPPRQHPCPMAHCQLSHSLCWELCLSCATLRMWAAPSGVG